MLRIFARVPLASFKVPSHDSTAIALMSESADVPHSFIAICRRCLALYAGIARKPAIGEGAEDGNRSIPAQSAEPGEDVLADYRIHVARVGVLEAIPAVITSRR